MNFDKLLDSLSADEAIDTLFDVDGIPITEVGQLVDGGQYVGGRRGATFKKLDYRSIAGLKGFATSGLVRRCVLVAHVADYFSRDTDRGLTAAFLHCASLFIAFGLLCECT